MIGILYKKLSTRKRLEEIRKRQHRRNILSLMSDDSLLSFLRWQLFWNGFLQYYGVRKCCKQLNLKIF